MTRAGFETGFVSLSDRFYRVAFYLLEDREKALDAVQDLFLKLWKMRDMLDGVRNPEAFGIVMIRNLCLDRIRKAAKLSFPEQMPEPETPHLQDEEMDSKMRLDKVLEAVKALPDRQREILLLRTVEGLSYEEIAQRTGMNYLTLRVLLSRARSTIKNQI